MARRLLLLPLLAALLLPALPRDGRAEAPALKIVAGTSLIEDIVRDLTDGRAEMITLVAGSSCPGHDNANPADFVFAAKADAMLIHAFQRDMPQTAGLLETGKPGGIRLEVIEAGGSWLVPEVQRKATRAVAEVLARLSPGAAPDINKRAETRLAGITRAEAEALSGLAALKNTPVVVADTQSEFVRWAGFTVLEAYRRSGEMTARDVANLVDALRGRKIAGVVDNLQSGADVGLPLALELKVPHVVLSNFPGSDGDVPDYFSLLRRNVSRLAGLTG
ncbi:MAG: zinc ABC transporter substrate-binding protein [Desulfovibrio sp.]|jgi:zinc transport system substrate-binding protein|nr:zinc ABC transporter substrate-binding protein [Desulfovibrio sp.]